MAEILKGAPVATALSESIRADVEELKAQGIVPTLAIVRVGERPDDLAYERGAMKRAEKVGVAVRNEVFPEDITEEAFFKELDRINQDDAVHGILMLQPLPKHIDTAKARDMIAPEKDIDGCTAISMAGVFTNRPLGYPPCTAAAAMEILHYYGIDPKGKRAVVIGRSLVIGRPVAMMLMHENATVTNCHTRTTDVPGITRTADILIAAAGVLKSVTPDYVNPDQVVIDVGINWDEEKGGIAGDVDFAAVEPVVKAITPVPGGVGSVTSTILMKHVVEAAKKI
ncbi:MAG: bifunctional 5,10-methylenetetrahydrofolate dehydrogenase/5,10-methenyltetrahydrofolate cyclohydrolase [Mogibacterium sp.]|nr:bifunctional 5,10-methylenetetrahydrofolate dehydrogenase/5,10-methenyltetrahydrofolate cyclohydrolase [Mogibacterium sp.]